MASRPLMFTSVCCRGNQSRRVPFLDEQAVLARLQKRVARWHLKQRLGIEQFNETRVFGQGRNFFHIENWYSVHSLIRHSLRLLLLYGRGKRNARQIQLRHNSFALKHLPVEFEGFILLQLSDLHLDMADDIPAAISQAIRELDYDVCVITGDLRARTYGDYQAALNGMQALRQAIDKPVYAVLGNHDSIRMVPDLERMDIHMLLNEAIAIEKAGRVIYLAGIDDPHYYRADNLERVTEQIPDGEVSILLSHSPEIYRHAAYTDFDIMLSGHTHGGQICLPGGLALSYNARCARSVCKGAWQYEQLQGYTSVGAGSCVVDVRLNCPPEVTLHKLIRG